MTQELIAKLESASEGSRELDLWIEGARYGSIGRLVGTTRDVPAYTTSIDAALALAERKGCDPSGVLHSAWSAVVRKHALHIRPFDGPSYTQAVALAICAAILRASAAEGAGHE